MKIDSTFSESRLAEKLDLLTLVAHQIPGVVIVHEIPAFVVRYISPRGTDFFKKSVEELREMGASYVHEYLNPIDAVDYIPQIMEMINRNVEEDSVSFFQQVRCAIDQDWVWHLSTTKIFMCDEMGRPCMAITVALPVEPLNHVTPKVKRLLEENQFLRHNYMLFARLTAREKEILKLLALSFSAGEIASALSLSVLTVETHRKNLRRKLEVTNAYELFRFAAAFDLI